MIGTFRTREEYEARCNECQHEWSRYRPAETHASGRSPIATRVDLYLTKEEKRRLGMTTAK